MANVLINDEYLNDIADAIRLKKSSNDTYKPREMADAIKTISTATSSDYIFDDLINKTYTGEFYSSSADKIPSEFMKMQPITMATGIMATAIERNAFYNCLNLVSANFPRVKTIYGGAFEGCESLVEVKIPSVTTIYGRAFKDCRNLEKLDLGHITSYPTDPTYQTYYGTLEGCSKLTHLIVRTQQVVNLPALPSQFKNDMNIAWIYVPAYYYNAYVNEYNNSYTYGYSFRKIEEYPHICG